MISQPKLCKSLPIKSYESRLMTMLFGGNTTPLRKKLQSSNQMAFELSLSLFLPHAYVCVQSARAFDNLYIEPSATAAHFLINLLPKGKIIDMTVVVRFCWLLELWMNQCLFNWHMHLMLLKTDIDYCLHPTFSLPTSWSRVQFINGGDKISGNSVQFLGLYRLKSLQRKL